MLSYPDCTRRGSQNFPRAALRLIDRHTQKPLIFKGWSELSDRAFGPCGGTPCRDCFSRQCDAVVFEPNSARAIGKLVPASY